MALATSKRKLLLGLAGLLAGGMCLVLALPIWMPWILRPALRREGVHYTTYQREGYSRFVLHHLTFTNQAVALHAGRVEGLLPLEWLRRHFFQTAPTQFLAVDDWELRFSGSTSSASAARGVSRARQNREKTDSVYGLFQEACTNVALLRNWLPDAQLNRGTVELSSRKILVPSAGWKNGLLSVEVQAPPSLPTATLEARVANGAAWEIRCGLPSAGLDTRVNIMSEAGSLRVSGDLLWQSNQVDLAAQFGQQGWLPEIVLVRSESFRIPAKLLKLPDYDDVTGSMAARWTNGQFDIHLSAGARPVAGQEHVRFPVTAVLQAHGDTNAVQVEQARVECPWLQVQLSPGAMVDFTGRLLSREAELRLAADLTRQPWVQAVGTLQGNALLRPSQQRYPDVSFQLAGAGLESSGIRAEKAEIEGQLTWPWLDVSRAQLLLADGSRSALIARANLETRFVTNGVLHLEGRFAVPGLVPHGVSYQNLLLHANGSGPFDQMTHAGILEVEGLVVPRSVPLQVTANWRGQHPDLDHFQVGVVAGGSILQMIGSAKAEQGEPGLRLEQLTLSKGGETLYALDRPCAVSLDRDTGGEKRLAPEWLFHLEPLLWGSPQRSLALDASLEWPRRGQWRASVENFNTSALDDFFKTPLPPIRVEHLGLSGSWSNSPVRLALDLDAHFKAGRAFGAAPPVPGKVNQPSSKIEDSKEQESWPFAIHLSAAGDGEGLIVKRFEMASQSVPVITGGGRFPVRLEPTNAAGRVRVDRDEALEVRASTVADERLWAQVSDWIGIGLVDPRLQLEVSGALSSPTGRITADLAAIRLPPLATNRPMPRLERVEAEVGLTRNALRLDSLSLQVEDQAVSARGQLPFGQDFTVDWQRFIQWSQATGTVRVAHAQLAPFARFLPKVLSPQGTLDVDMAVRPNLELEGQLVLKGAATRPLNPIGPVQDMEARLSASGRQLEIRSFSGLLGGDPFAVSGIIDFNQLDPRTEMPQVQLRIRGSNLPLVRDPDLILRSDLDLSVSNPTNGPVVVAGMVQLRDSVFLSDLKDLKPGKIAQPHRRPPYFSIDIDPLADWKLDVRVRGDKFLRVRSLLFLGQVSTDLKLEGNLREPVALGEVAVNNGVIQFPFANLEVTQGLVSLTSADPYRPRLFVTASGRTFGYEIKIEVSGSADSPVIQFSSIPPLSSDQIVLMLTAGALPKDTTSSTLTMQQRASRLALFLGKSLLSELAPGQGSADRLTVRSDETLLDPGKPTYTLEYRLNKRWSLVGEYDQYSDVNVGLKWRIYSH